MANSKTSKHTMVWCPLGGWGCAILTKELRKSNAPTTEEPVWCPGGCTARERKAANIKTCVKLGLNPAEILDIMGLPKVKQR